MTVAVETEQAVGNDELKKQIDHVKGKDDAIKVTFRLPDTWVVTFTIGAEDIDFQEPRMVFSKQGEVYFSVRTTEIAGLEEHDNKLRIKFQGRDHAIDLHTPDDFEGM